MAMRHFDIKSSLKGSLSHWLGRQQPCHLCGSNRATLYGLCQPCAADLPRPSPDWPSMPGLPDLVCALEYRYPVDMLVRHLKYRGQLQLAPLLAHQLKIALEAHPSQPLLQRRGLRLAFVPQSRERLRERGFNQAEEITRRLSGSTGIPLLAGGPKRNRATPHQAGPGRDGRQRNLAGAFHCAGPLQGQTIALVDDVITTGATLGAVAATLLAAGAKQVLPWVVARTPPPDFAPMR